MDSQNTTGTVLFVFGVTSCRAPIAVPIFYQMFENEARDCQIRRIYDKTAKFYSMLPDEFTTQDVMRIWGYRNLSAASRKLSKMTNECVIEKIEKGKYMKLAKAI